MSRYQTTDNNARTVKCVRVNDVVDVNNAVRPPAGVRGALGGRRPAQGSGGTAAPRCTCSTFNGLKGLDPSLQGGVGEGSTVGSLDVTVLTDTNRGQSGGCKGVPPCCGRCGYPLKYCSCTGMLPVVGSCCD